MHPVGKLYVIVTVPPVMLVISPVVPPIVAIVTFPLLHAPPVAASVKVAVSHTNETPPMAGGNGLMVSGYKL